MGVGRLDILVCREANGMRIIYTAHARQRMTRRSIGNANVLAVLANDDEPEPLEHGNLYKYTFSGLSVIAVEKVNKTIVVSAWHDNDK